MALANFKKWVLYCLMFVSIHNITQKQKNLLTLMAVIEFHYVSSFMCLVGNRSCLGTPKYLR